MKQQLQDTTNKNADRRMSTRSSNRKKNPRAPTTTTTFSSSSISNKKIKQNLKRKKNLKKPAAAVVPRSASKQANSKPEAFVPIPNPYKKSPIAGTDTASDMPELVPRKKDNDDCCYDDDSDIEDEDNVVNLPSQEADMPDPFKALSQQSSPTERTMTDGEIEAFASAVAQNIFVGDIQDINGKPTVVPPTRAAMIDSDGDPNSTTNLLAGILSNGSGLGLSDADSKSDLTESIRSKAASFKRLIKNVRDSHSKFVARLADLVDNKWQPGTKTLRISVAIQGKKDQSCITLLNSFMMQWAVKFRNPKTQACYQPNYCAKFAKQIFSCLKNLGCVMGHMTFGKLTGSYHRYFENQFAIALLRQPGFATNPHQAHVVFNDEAKLREAIRAGKLDINNYDDLRDLTIWKVSRDNCLRVNEVSLLFVCITTKTNI